MSLKGVRAAVRAAGLTVGVGGVAAFAEDAYASCIGGCKDKCSSCTSSCTNCNPQGSACNTTLKSISIEVPLE